MLTVTFWGVRGSTPCPCEENRNYGGNTACVALEAPGQDPIVLDLGTGLRFFGESIMGRPEGGRFKGTALVTHMHWDHVQGLPFFVPINLNGSELDIYAPPQDGVSVEAAFSEFMRPPYFPVRTSDLFGSVRFHDCASEDIKVGRAVIKVRDVPHVGATNGYRVESEGVSVAYLSDHQQPVHDPDSIAPSVLELCQGADLVIHDAQYMPEEFEQKATWGHCTVEYAVKVAARSGARRLALFHHDPGRNDVALDGLLAYARELGEKMGLEEVVAASERLTMVLSPRDAMNCLGSASVNGSSAGALDPIAKAGTTRPLTGTPPTLR